MIAVLLGGKTPWFCGGANTKQCYGLINNEWKPGPYLISLHYRGSGFAINETSWLLFGGQGQYSGEIISDQSRIGTLIQNNPNGRPSAGCMVRFNDTTALSFAGSTWQSYETNSYYYSITEDAWKTGGLYEMFMVVHLLMACFEGPRVIPGQRSPICGLLKDLSDPNVKYVVVTGKKADHKNYKATSSIWKVGTDSFVPIDHMPEDVDTASGVVSSDGKSFYVVGGHWRTNSEWGYSKKIYRLQCENMSCTWTKMPQELKFGREDHTAILVPDSEFPCHNNDDA